jgi:hypothetical protein
MKLAGTNQPLIRVPVTPSHAGKAPPVYRPAKPLQLKAPAVYRAPTATSTSRASVSPPMSTPGAQPPRFQTKPPLSLTQSLTQPSARSSIVPKAALGPIGGASSTAKPAPFKPGWQSPRLAVLQRAQLEEQKAVTVKAGMTVGDWTLNTQGASADLWATDQWKMSYYRASGDYHIKGKSGARAKSERGLFSREYRRVAATGPIGLEMDQVYDAWVTNVLPLYK